MATKHDLVDWVVEALNALGGSSRLSNVAKHIWQTRETELRRSGELFYTWQYDMRWAALTLRKRGIMKAADVSPSGLWELGSADK